MNPYVHRNGLQVADVLADLVEKEILPGTGVSAEKFWEKFARLVDDLGPANRSLLEQRDLLQARIDDWYHTQQVFDVVAQKQFLLDIGYLLPEGDAFEITTANVDDEIAAIAGPQLVVPVSNARYALNATNARWGSLFDALYGTDVIPETGGCERSAPYNPVRGARVIAKAFEILDMAAPLENGSHADVREYVRDGHNLVARLHEGTAVLARREQFAGYREGVSGALQSILLRNNGLHIDILIDRNSAVGKTTGSGVEDIILEAAVSTIQDFEDSVSAVDAADKTAAYRNWLGLMKGELETSFVKGGRMLKRRMNGDRHYTSPTGATLTLHGRSLLMIRNVGIAMYTDAVLDSNAREIPEGFLDAVISAACAMHDLNRAGKLRNSRTGSLYVVKPKLHGVEETAFTAQLFARVEDIVGLPRFTMKIGVMDEERRTTVNLKECIRQVKERLVFINTGFLDRTADEIHTSMEAGPMLPKETIKGQPWLSAYENWNVDIGLECGLKGKAQIGKGMWAKPEAMAEMLQTKIAHPKAGANCAWVPSPTAATLHAIHYHQVCVSKAQEQLASRKRAQLDHILLPPFLGNFPLTPQAIQAELDNNVQGILGYVVRWIDQGVGCSKVPNISNVELMEDRATLRISSQHIANWLRHGILDKTQVMETLRRLAAVVDAQNASDPAYIRMAADFDNSLAFQAACELIFLGCKQPNGYTEKTLHRFRRIAKSAPERRKQQAINAL